MNINFALVTLWQEYTKEGTPYTPTYELYRTLAGAVVLRSHSIELLTKIAIFC